MKFLCFLLLVGPLSATIDARIDLLKTSNIALFGSFQTSSIKAQPPAPRLVVSSKAADASIAIDSAAVVASCVLANTLYYAFSNNLVKSFNQKTDPQLSIVGQKLDFEITHLVCDETNRNIIAVTKSNATQSLIFYWNPSSAAGNWSPVEFKGLLGTVNVVENTPNHIWIGGAFQASLLQTGSGLNGIAVIVYSIEKSNYILVPNRPGILAASAVVNSISLTDNGLIVLAGLFTVPTVSGGVNLVLVDPTTNFKVSKITDPSGQVLSSTICNGFLYISGPLKDSTQTFSKLDLSIPTGAWVSYPAAILFNRMVFDKMEKIIYLLPVNKNEVIQAFNLINQSFRKYSPVVLGVVSYLSVLPVNGISVLSVFGNIGSEVQLYSDNIVEIGVDRKLIAATIDGVGKLKAGTNGAEITNAIVSSSLGVIAAMDDGNNGYFVKGLEEKGNGVDIGLNQNDEISGWLWIGGSFSIINKISTFLYPGFAVFNKNTKAFENELFTGLSINPSVAPIVNSIVSDSALGYIVVGGQFQFNIGGVSCVNLCIFDTKKLTWSIASYIIPNSINALVFKNNLLFIGGNFSAPPDSKYAYFATYDIQKTKFQTFQTPPQTTSPITSFATSQTETYIFINMQTPSGQPRLIQWDPTANTPSTELSLPPKSIVNSMALLPRTTNPAGLASILALVGSFNLPGGVGNCTAVLYDTNGLGGLVSSMNGNGVAGVGRGIAYFLDGGQAGGGLYLSVGAIIGISVFCGVLLFVVFGYFLYRLFKARRIRKEHLDLDEEIEFGDGGKNVGREMSSKIKDSLDLHRSYVGKRPKDVVGINNLEVVYENTLKNSKKQQHWVSRAGGHNNEGGEQMNSEVMVYNDEKSTNTTEELVSEIDELNNSFGLGRRYGGLGNNSLRINGQMNEVYLDDGYNNNQRLKKSRRLSRSLHSFEDSHKLSRPQLKKIRDSFINQAPSQMAIGGYGGSSNVVSSPAIELFKDDISKLKKARRRSSWNGGNSNQILQEMMLGNLLTTSTNIPTSSANTTMLNIYQDNVSMSELHVSESSFEVSANSIQKDEYFPRPSCDDDEWSSITNDFVDEMSKVTHEDIKRLTLFTPPPTNLVGDLMDEYNKREEEEILSPSATIRGWKPREFRDVGPSDIYFSEKELKRLSLYSTISE